jgi:hypothetical protein
MPWGSNASLFVWQALIQAIKQICPVVAGASSFGVFRSPVSPLLAR